jgi:hypothetical protein
VEASQLQGGCHEGATLTQGYLQDKQIQMAVSAI